METKYIGEHLLPGQLGHFFAVLSFVAAIVATISYVKTIVPAGKLSGEREEALRLSWRRLARWAFVIQAAAVFATFFSLYFALYNHYFEYKYVWRNSSRNLQTSYLLASFWADQEGSFLLWSIWTAVLGLILVRVAKKWEGPVLAVMSFAQVCLASMLLGIFILGYRVGSNPFLLLRLSEENQGLPWVSLPNYLDFIKDGNGLNLALRNYWMVIHPPILFLGFASTIVPFAFAVAGMWTRDYKNWIKPALPWSLFSAMILGTGIMMGAAWAYESLTFGGYWAWDPVENASLVPWLTLVAGVHTLLAYKHTGHALKATFFFFFITFVLILYSTFLTRSGILGDTSVHSFTDLGMSGQLLVYMGVFAIPAFALLIMRRKEIPAVVREESSYSREFWLFIGALILLIAAIQITFTTSIPVWNKLLKISGIKGLFKLGDLAPPSDNMFHYNRIQIWIGIVLGLLTAAVQYLKYKDTPGRQVIQKLGLPTVISLVATGLIGWLGKMNYDNYGGGFLIAVYIMLFASVYAIIANFSYIFIGNKGRLKVAGASVAHVGFGLVLLGILITSAKKEVISLDRMKMLDNGFFGEKSKENPRENLMLPRNFPVQMGDYHVTYAGDSLSASGDEKTFYLVRYEKKDPANGNIQEKFTLHPDAYLSNRGEQALTPNPDSKHYLTKDIFTYITAVPVKDDPNDTAQYHTHEVAPGDTVFLTNGYVVLEALRSEPKTRNYAPADNQLAVGAQLKVVSNSNEQFSMMPVFYVRDSIYPENVPDTVSPMSLYVRFNRVLPEEKKISLDIKESTVFKDYIVMKAFVFPFINMLWLGVLVMIVGFVMSIVQRVKANKTKM